jgi:hypothetical protein
MLDLYVAAHVYEALAGIKIGGALTASTILEGVPSCI